MPNCISNESPKPEEGEREERYPNMFVVDFDFSRERLARRSHGMDVENVYRRGGKSVRNTRRPTRNRQIREIVRFVLE